MAEKAIFTFSKAAALANVKAKALRGWLDRNQVRYPSLANRDENTWRRFTMMDVLHLAIVAEIIKYDFRIEFADEVAFSITNAVTYRTIDGFDMPDTASLDRILKLTLQLRHPEHAGDRSPSGDEMISKDDQDRYGAYLVIKPIRIWIEISERMLHASSTRIDGPTAARLTEGLIKGMTAAFQALNEDASTAQELGRGPRNRKSARSA